MLFKVILKAFEAYLVQFRPIGKRRRKMSLRTQPGEFPRVEFPIQMVGRLPHQLVLPHQLFPLPHQLWSCSVDF